MSIKPITPTQARLMATLRFSPLELYTNQTGRMTIFQRRKVSAQRWPLLFNFLPMLVTCSAGYVAIMVDVIGNNRLTLSVFLVATGMILGMAGWFMWLIRKRLAQIQADLSAMQVATIKGQASAHKRVFTNVQKTWGSGAEVTVENLTFNIPPNAVAAFQTEDDYCVYFAPNSLTLLSVEHVKRHHYH